MTSSNSTAPTGRLREVYIEELRTHAVTLIWLGYARLNATSFATAEEDVITGELVKQIKQVQDEIDDDWASHYHISEQVPQNVDAKQGKRRPKMDIEIERNTRGIRPKLGFEAKRLGTGFGVGTYLGDSGMTAFLTCYYPTTHQEAGMLGYVQDGLSSDWPLRLDAALKGDSKKYCVATDGAWTDLSVSIGQPCFSTGHIDTGNNSLRIIHVLLPAS